MFPYIGVEFMVYETLKRQIEIYNGVAAGTATMLLCGALSGACGQASAHPLDDDQVAALKQQLRTRVGSDVSVDLQVDPDLLGGLVVRIGSQMIDSSIRTRLNALASAMKG